jgi:hypothetical protein
MSTPNALEYLQLNNWSSDEIKVECALQDISVNELAQQVYDNHEASMEKDSYLNPTYA